VAENSAIEWTTHTANLWWGCTEVHAGCDNCYARTFARRVGKANGWDGVRYATRGIWNDLLKWDRAARDAGRIDRVFCGSMMDIFEKSLPVADWQGNNLADAETGQLRDRYLREVVPATPNLMHLLLTKRPSNILKMVPKEWLQSWPDNVMTGTSPVDQDTADTLISQLVRVPGRHFLSVEPLLGPVNLWLPTRTWTNSAGGATCDHCCNGDRCDDPTHYERGRPEWRIRCPHCRGTGNGKPIDWVIAGGESGPKARPMHPDWARALRDQCAAADVPFLFKQWGEHAPTKRTMAEVASSSRKLVPVPLTGTSPFPAALVDRVGKKAAGRLLDGVEHNGFPEVACAT
jgi:protein gp37